MAQTLRIWEDSPIAIWNDLQTQDYVHGLDSLYPAFAVIALFLIIHLLMDKLLYSRAAAYAKTVCDITPPEWIETSEYAAQLTFEKISPIYSKKFAKSIKKYDLDSLQKRQLTKYQKNCNKFAVNVKKYQTAFFKVCVFGCVYFYGLGLLYVDAPWFWDQKFMWRKTQENIANHLPPQSPGNDPLFNLNIYYFLQIGTHGHRIIYQFFEHSRKDFWAMFVHHVVATLLLIGSKMTGYQQIGATVLLCNDNLDLIMPLAKLCGYMGYPNARMVLAILWCLMWIPFRIGLYFQKVLWQLMTDGYVFCLRPFAIHWFCFLGLLVIYFLQFIWTKYLLEMVWGKIVHGREGIEDTRSASDNEQEVNNKKTK